MWCDWYVIRRNRRCRNAPKWRWRETVLCTSHRNEALRTLKRRPPKIVPLAAAKKGQA